MGRRAQRNIRMLETLSPAGVLENFRPAQDTLVELDLFDTGDVRWPDHDGSRFNLSEFSCLKRLSLDSICIFPPGGSWASRMGLCGLLPRSIEDIKVSMIHRSCK